jgi:hypothetical protein
MGADFDGIHAITVHVVGQAAILAHLEVPWRPDPAAGVDHRTFAEFGSEDSKQKPTPNMKNLWAGPEQKDPYETPEHTPKLVFKAMRGRAF